VWDRRWIIFLAAGAALAAVYRRALIDEAQGELLTSWVGFVLIWLPAAAVIGLTITYLWPWARRKLHAMRRRP